MVLDRELPSDAFFDMATIEPPARDAKIAELRNFVKERGLDVDTSGDGRSPEVKARIYHDILACPGLAPEVGFRLASAHEQTPQLRGR